MASDAPRRTTPATVPSASSWNPICRAEAGRPWAVATLLPGNTLALPEIGTEVPVAELHKRVDLPESRATPDGNARRQVGLNDMAAQAGS